MAGSVPVPDVFVMRGARAAMAQGLAHVEEQVTALERAVLENPGLALDLAKTLVESACRTILTERQQSYASDDDLPKLFKTVTTFLPLSPPSASSSSGHRSLKQTLNGLHTALQGVCELRNDFGFASHGSDGSRPRMESIQAMLAAQAADTIVGFLHATHQQDRAVQRTAPLRFEDHADFNDYIDDAHGSFQMFSAELPSERGSVPRRSRGVPRRARFVRRLRRGRRKRRSREPAADRGGGGMSRMRNLEAWRKTFASSIHAWAVVPNRYLGKLP